MARQPSHRIHVDLERKLIDVRPSGFFTPEDAGWVGEDVRAAVLSLGADVGRHVTLYDFSEVEIVPAATVDAINGMFANPKVRPLWARKVAIVSPSALMRLQAARMREARRDIEVFENRAAALGWLLAE